MRAAFLSSFSGQFDCPLSMFITAGCHPACLHICGNFIRNPAFLNIYFRQNLHIPKFFRTFAADLKNRSFPSFPH